MIQKIAAADKLPYIDMAFDPRTHTYTRNGVILPSVTQILRPISNTAYREIPQGTLDYAADRGTRLHNAISTYILGKKPDIYPDTQGYFNAFLAFEKLYNPAWLASEFPIYHKNLPYAGTIDIIGYVTPDNGKGVDVIDIKTVRAPHARLLEAQLSAYAEALKSHDTRVRDLYSLVLTDKGSFKMVKHTNNYKLFLACMMIHTEMERRD